MTPKEKAETLVTAFYDKQVEMLNKENLVQWHEIEHEIAVQCALIAVDEIINVLLINKSYPDIEDIFSSQITYWQQVKQEIEKL